jgi:hypothetical protein
MDGGVIDSMLNVPAALADLCARADSLATFTAPIPPQAALIALLCAVLLITADVAARKARGLPGKTKHRG